ncbi:uncharacterized protein LOC126374807 isoform X2 [Pectinophora gossypiella]|uniref:uncharacterized protein LOC126374807 isoform X2 n=1 Tax=Pectinophora gossypiella TaxID=13191 RepID=UPI00214E7873|nr:uncharacterized protein LOC126374807 isoform X2 [Pectinophora gossypiella]
MWDHESELHFLEIYKTESVLWEPSHKFYKNRKKLQDAWLRISEQTGYSVDELKRKRDSLMATYRGHLRKIQTTMKSGLGREHVYEPIWFAFEFMNSFLGHLYKSKNTVKAENQGNRYDDEDETDDRQEIPMETVYIEEAPRPATTRRRINPPELMDTSKIMKQAICTLNTILQKKSDTREDDCDRYGKILANKLRKLCEDERLQIMYEIDGLFIKNMQNKSLSTTIYNTAD